MKRVSALLDDAPTAALCQEMVACDILNRQAHVELTTYNATAKFACVHPFVIERQHETNLLATLQNLRDHDPDEFLRQVTNTNQNIRRIESNIRTQKYKNNPELANWQKNLQQARLKQKLMASLIQSPDTDTLLNPTAQ